MKQALVFGGLCLCILFAPWWMCALYAAGYALWRPAYELVPLGVIVDAHFGAFSGGAGVWYTLLFTTLLFTAETLKPRLSYYAAS